MELNTRQAEALIDAINYLISTKIITVNRQTELMEVIQVAVSKMVTVK